MGMRIAADRPQPRRRRSYDRRASYVAKVADSQFDEFNVDDIREFFADLYRLSYGMRWIPESLVLANKIFGEIVRDLGPRRALNFVAASFGHPIPPRDLRWYMSGMARDISSDQDFDHYMARAGDLLDDWITMHTVWEDDDDNGMTEIVSRPKLGTSVA